MLELYTHPMSPCAQKVRIVLAEKGLDWKKHHIDLPNKENLRPEYLKLNPLGVVPTLVHDGRPVIESSIICEYLNDAFPHTPLMPADAYAASQIRLWMKHVDTKLHPSCGAVQWPLLMLPGLLKKSEAEREAAYASAGMSGVRGKASFKYSQMILDSMTGRPSWTKVGTTPKGLSLRYSGRRFSLLGKSI